jgi:DNA-directed RNA polymerase specialized sigma24 family protein
MTARKVVDLRRYNAREKRRVRGQSALARPGGDDPAGNLDAVIGDSPSPELAAEVVDQCRHLLGLLGDDELERIALAKMEGYANVEIAGKLGCSVRSVERQLRLIRKKWEGELKKGQNGQPG